MFLVTKLRKNTQSMYQKIFKKKRVDFLLIEKKRKKHYVLIKDFNTFMCDYTVDFGRKVCSYGLQDF